MPKASKVSIFNSIHNSYGYYYLLFSANFHSAFWTDLNKEAGTFPKDFIHGGFVIAGLLFRYKGFDGACKSAAVHTARAACRCVEHTALSVVVDQHGFADSQCHSQFLFLRCPVSVDILQQLIG